MSHETDFSCMEEVLVVSLGGRVYADVYRPYVKQEQEGMTVFYVWFKSMGDEILMVRLVLEGFPDDHLW